jgi:nucleoside-diphosphate-sugar epimerase
VTGTGAQGRAISRAFNNSGKWHVRVLTRDPTGPVAKALGREGMELVQVNFEDKESLRKAFRGAYAVSQYRATVAVLSLEALQVFSVTIPPWHKMYSITMGEYEQGVLQADIAKEANVQLFLFSTLPYVGPNFMGLGGVELYDGR